MPVEFIRRPSRLTLVNVAVWPEIEPNKAVNFKSAVSGSWVVGSANIEYINEGVGVTVTCALVNRIVAQRFRDVNQRVIRLPVYGA